jgi:hypothetical protein
MTTAGATDQYSKAMALQDFFRGQGAFENEEPAFTYALNPAKPGHDNSAIEAFLETRSGYCEMYAGTYAAMARSVGLPARVAVGFTWGEPDKDNPNLYHVKGRYAHAWPEVWLGEQIGWIAFEPTPGRGAPDMQAYNHVEPAQADPSGEGATQLSTTTTAPPTSSTTTPSSNQDDLAALLGTGQTNGRTQVDDGPNLVVRLGTVALVLLGAVILYALVALGYGALRRRRRRKHAVEPRERIALAWEESLEELELAGVVRRQSETHTEFASRAGRAVPERIHQLDELASLADFVTYAPDAIDAAEADRADAASSAIVETVHARVSRRTVWINRLDPRRLGRATSSRPRQQARSSKG